MIEILADLAVVFGEKPVRAARVRRVRRRLAAGQPARVPVSAKSERPGWPPEYVSGGLLLTPGTALAFGSRKYPLLEFLTGGELSVTDPATWYDGEWATAVYRAPGGGPEIHLQAHLQYLPVLRAALRG